MSKTPPKRQPVLETANEMFKAAFSVKRCRIAELNPGLSKLELDAKTAEYFREQSLKQK